MRFANAIPSTYIFIFPSKFDLSHGRVFAVGHKISLCSHNPLRSSLRTIGKCNTLASRYIALGLRYVRPIKRGAPCWGPGRRNVEAERHGGNGAETGSGKKRSRLFNIEQRRARSLDRDKHRGHNKVWINERGILPRRSSPKVRARDFSLLDRWYKFLNVDSAINVLWNVNDRR